jgi:DNA repair protein RadC
MGSYSARVIARLPMVGEAKGPRLNTSEKVAELCKDMEGLAQETFHLLTLDQKHKVIDRHMVALGSLTGTIVHPREVFRLALLDCAAAVMFVHNHPSGDTKPSRDDLELTARLVDAAKLLGIRVLDHVIIGRDGRHFSFCVEGLL